MANEIKVSVIIPIYNAYDYLRPAMDSAIYQTLRDIEIICVDDGSTDHSLDIIKEYQKNDERIRIVTETNAGPAVARNNGINRARGEYLAFFDADDFLEPTFLEAMYEKAKEGSLDIVISGYDIYNSRRASFSAADEGEHNEIYADGVVTSKNENPDYILASTNSSAWNKLFRRDFVLSTGLRFLDGVRMYEDVFFVVCAVALAEKIAKVPGVLMHHRVHSEQSRVKSFKKYYSQIPVVYTRIKEFLMSRGMYAPLSFSFLNLSASRCFKVYNLLGGDAKEGFWDMIHETYSEQLGWSERTSADFESGEVCDFVANVQMYDYDEYKWRISHGRKLKLDDANHKRKYKVAKNKKKWRSFVAKNFPFFSRRARKKKNSGNAK